jgi:hypothetical protein
MKYLEQYIEEKMKIKVLGKLTTRESNSGEEVGVSLVIDGYEPGIEVWYADYCAWLEEKIAKGAVGSEGRVQEVTNEEGMVPVDKVWEWLYNNFWTREHDGDYNYGQEYVSCAFDNVSEMYDDFRKVIGE